jgi:hypothetical protein
VYVAKKAEEDMQEHAESYQKESALEEKGTDEMVQTNFKTSVSHPRGQEARSSSIFRFTADQLCFHLFPSLSG